MKFHRAVARRCEEFTQATGIVVSPYAIGLVADVLGSIEVDPHPAWRASAADREISIEHFLDELPGMLAQIYRDTGQQNVVTSFDIVHFLGERLHALCPFEKVPRRIQLPGHPEGPLRRRREG